jgi:glycosyltransferase involved in cell wall biosynthesis
VVDDRSGARPDSSPIRILAIVTCHDRLPHLRETLPLIAQAFDVLVVDYDCPQVSAAWVGRFADGQIDGVYRAHVHATHVSRDPDGPPFFKPAALNAGAQWAMAHAYERLLFLDADTVVEEPAEVAAELAELGPDEFMLAGRAGRYDRPGLTGILGVHVGDLVRANGFDRRYHGWGVEDVDMRLELRALGRRPRWFTSEVFSTIKHDDLSRVVHRSSRPLETPRQSWARARGLFLLKWSDRLGLELRRGLDFPPEFRELLFHNATIGGPL